MGKQPKLKTTATAASTTRRTDGRKEEDKHKGNPALSFPESDYFIKAKSFSMKGNRYKFKKLLLQGSAKGCIHCLIMYAYKILYSFDDPSATDGESVLDCDLMNHKNLHLAYPFCLEGAIRGNGGSIVLLHKIIYSADEKYLYNTEKYATTLYWQKFYDKQELEAICDKMARKSIMTNIGNMCHGCNKEESETVTLEKCSGCNFYFYCSAECQKKMWLNGGHAGECRQLAILKQYHRPHGKHIRDRLVNGADPKDIPELQELRRQLGLDRPKSEYKDLLEQVKSGRIEPCHLIDPNKDGTVQLGSFPHPM